MADHSELVQAVMQSSQRLGINPSDLLTAMSYETGSKLDPNLWGGKGGKHLGLIQFGPWEQEKYGVKPGMPIGEQVTAAENFLRDRGVKPGMGLLDLYSTVNAGRPGLYDRSDAANGGAPGTVRDKVANQMVGHRARAEALLGGQAMPAQQQAAGQPAQQPVAAPLSLVPQGAEVTPDADPLLAALQKIPLNLGQRQQQNNLEHAEINYPVAPGLQRARALARLMSNTRLG